MNRAFKWRYNNQPHSQCQRHGLAVPRASDRFYVTGSIRGWNRSHLTYVTCWLEERKLTSQSSSITVELSVQYILKITSKSGQNYWKSHQWKSRTIEELPLVSQGAKKKSSTPQETQMGDERAKKVFDDTRAGNGDVSATAKQKRSSVFLTKSWRAWDAKVKKAACGLRAALCPPLMWSIWLQNQRCCSQAPEDSNYGDSLILPQYSTNRKGKEWGLYLLKSSCW